MRSGLVAALAVFSLAGCISNYQIPLTVSVGDLGITQRRPKSVALYIPESVANHVAVEICGNCTGANHIPLGPAFDAAAREAFAQSFQSATVIRDLAQASPAQVVVAPRIERFNHTKGLDRMQASVTVAVDVLRDGNKVWQRSFGSPDKLGSPFHITVEAYQRSVSSAVAEAMREALAMAARALADDVSLASALGGATSTSASLPAAKPPTVPAQAGFPKGPVDVRFPAVPERSDDIAVVIGNADYSKQGRDIPNVVPAYADAEGAKRYAIEALGIREGNVIFLKDATSAQITRVFGSKDDHRGQLFDWVKPGRSRVFVYYSGHGAPGSQSGNPYLVPADADAARIELNGYPLKTLYDNLGKLPADSVTVMLEACFSGTSQAGSVITRASPVFTKVQPPRVPAKLTILAAGAANQIASWEQDSSHSLFTKYFLLGQSGEADKSPHGNGDGRVSLDELDRYLKETLTYYARRYYGRDQTAQIVAGK